jgi:hypothetical protein
MAADFTVIIDVRHHFGDDEGYFGNVPFAGQNKPFQFNCPGIDASEWSILLFQTRDVDHEKNHFTVNDQKIFGGIPVSSQKEDWNGNVALINPGWLRETGNTLHVGSRNSEGSLLGESDDFLIDNVVLFYKTSKGAGSLIQRS